VLWDLQSLSQWPNLCKTISRSVNLCISFFSSSNLLSWILVLMRHPYVNGQTISYLRALYHGRRRSPSSRLDMAAPDAFAPKVLAISELPTCIRSLGWIDRTGSLRPPAVPPICCFNARINYRSIRAVLLCRHINYYCTNVFVDNYATFAINAIRFLE
jgi:hypothetical protein